jgi:hypothetical protein
MYAAISEKEITMANLGDKIFSYSRSDLERKIDRLLVGMATTPPILSEQILDRVPDVKRIEVRPLLTTDLGCEAMVITPVFMHRDLIVVVDQEVMNAFDQKPYQMAIAEEIGHIELHRAVMLEIQTENDFADLQQHPAWAMAERDAKYFARAMLMPTSILEPAAHSMYERVANEIGFGDSYKFWSTFTTHLSEVFEIPRADAQKRLETYPRDLVNRVEKSIAARHPSLLRAGDTISVSGHTEVTEEQLYGDPTGER